MILVSWPPSGFKEMGFQGTGGPLGILWVPGVLEWFILLPMGVPVVLEGFDISLIALQWVFAEIISKK